MSQLADDLGKVATISTQAARIKELETALGLIDGGRCERVTGEGHRCGEHSRWSRDAKFHDDRWCDSCIANAAIRADKGQ